MRVCYLNSHQAGLCCCLVILVHIENLLRPLQMVYFHLWPIYWLSLIKGFVSARMYDFPCFLWRNVCRRMGPIYAEEFLLRASKTYFNIVGRYLVGCIRCNVLFYDFEGLSIIRSNLLVLWLPHFSIQIFSYSTRAVAVTCLYTSYMLHNLLVMWLSRVCIQVPCFIIYSCCGCHVSVYKLRAS
jgi:hypothetical protein